jgi:hypothetical protein
MARVEGGGCSTATTFEYLDKWAYDDDAPNYSGEPGRRQNVGFWDAFLEIHRMNVHDTKTLT